MEQKGKKNLLVGKSNKFPIPDIIALTVHGNFASCQIRRGTGDIIGNVNNLLHPMQLLYGTKAPFRWNVRKNERLQDK
jgi:hypothetical protein